MTLSVAPLLLALVAGCTRSQDVPLGKPLFRYDHLRVDSLTLAKNDIASEDRWTAQVERLPTDPPTWQVRSAPRGVALLDRLANGGFIQHLLDSLRSLQPVRDAPQGPPESFGLTPPWFALRWSEGPGTAAAAPKDAAPARQHEVHLALPWARDGSFYAMLPLSQRIFVARGPVPRLLQELKTFDDLRLRRLLTFPLDDVDEIEFAWQARAPYYVQRQGTKWANEKGKPARPFRGVPVPKLVERVDALRVRAFVDDAGEVARLANELKLAPRYEVTLKDRRGNPTVIRVAETGTSSSGPRKRAIASISSRPQAVFELEAAALDLFER